MDTMTTTTLYRFYNSADELLYIGIAGNPGRRFSEHAKTKPWWPQVARSTMEHHSSRGAALAAEERAIRTERPLHNVVHNRAPRHAELLTSTHDCRWACTGCGSEIQDGDGHIEVEREPNEHGVRMWRAWHTSCDPDLEGCQYWIAVERIRTKADLNGWTVHLEAKVWVQRTNWQCINVAQHYGDRPFGTHTTRRIPYPECGLACTAATAFSSDAVMGLLARLAPA